MILRGLMLGFLGMSSACAADMIEVRYVDQYPGSPAALTRILVTPDFMRMDGGVDEDDFVLVDRRQRKVINIMHEHKMAMVFKPGKLPPKPAHWKSRLDTQNTERSGVMGFTLSVGDVVCSKGTAAPRAAPDAARAMAEMKAILASLQYSVWTETPASLQHDCDLANQVWETGTTLKLGLPLEEQEFTGRKRVFESESRQPLKSKLFRVPKGMSLINAPS